jgi:HK97 gp10 family phage protein
MSQFIRVTNGDAELGVKLGNDNTLTEISERIITQAKELSPVDLGQLKNSIMYKLANNSTGGFNDSSGEKASGKISKPPAGASHVGFNLLYGIYQEFGTRKMKPQPFLRPALDIVVNKTDTAKVIEKIMAEQMLGALEKGQKRETFNV